MFAREREDFLTAVQCRRHPGWVTTVLRRSQIMYILVGRATHRDRVQNLGLGLIRGPLF